VRPAPARAPEEDGVNGWLIIAAGLGLIALAAVVRHRRVRDNVQPYAATRLERDVL